MKFLPQFFPMKLTHSNRLMEAFFIGLRFPGDIRIIRVIDTGSKQIWLK